MAIDSDTMIKTLLGKYGGPILGDAREVFKAEVGPALFVAINQGKKFIRMSEDSYFRNLRVRAEKYIVEFHALEKSYSLTGFKYNLTGFKLSEYVDSYLNEVKKKIRGCIERLRPGIQQMSINIDSCRLLRDFIDRECPYFSVRFEQNFVGNPYFMFYFQGQDMFGGEGCP